MFRYVVNCNRISSFPDLQLTLNARTYRMSGRNYTETVGDMLYHYHGVSFIQISGQCYLALLTYDDPMVVAWFLGTLFTGPYCQVINYVTNTYALHDLKGMS